MPAKRHGRVVLIHGAHFRKRDKDNLRRLAVAFRATGFCPVLPTYGFLPALVLGMFRWLDDRIADAMAGFIREDDILLGHSNGATLVYLISQRVKIKGAILVNAALDSDRVPNAQFIHVYFNRGDILTRIARFFPWSPWGAMGGEGYTGHDWRVTNFDQANTPGMPKLNGHSDVFKRPNVRPWGRYMAERCLDALAKLKSARWSNYHD